MKSNSVEPESVGFLTYSELEEMGKKVSEKTIKRMSLTDAKRILMSLKNEMLTRMQRIFDENIFDEISDILIDAGFSVIPSDENTIYVHNGEEAFEIDVLSDDIEIEVIDLEDLGLNDDEMDEARNIWYDVSRYARSGIQLKRKDKDLISDTGGESKKRKEPKSKPSRIDQIKPFSKKHKKPDELDKDVDKDKDLKLADELLNIFKLLR